MKAKSHRSGRRRRLPEQDAFEQFNRCFDHEVYALELEYHPDLGDAILAAVRRRLDGKQVAFEKMLAAHPATLAEQERRERRAREAQASRRRRKIRAGLKRLANLWHAKLCLSTRASA